MHKLSRDALHPWKWCITKGCISVYSHECGWVLLVTAQQVMYNKSNLGDKCYVCNISNYTNRILETSTYLTGGISLSKVFPTLQSWEHCPTKTQESYVATKSSREKMSTLFHINLAKTNEQLIFRFAKVECT